MNPSSRRAAAARPRRRIGALVVALAAVHACAAASAAQTQPAPTSPPSVPPGPSLVSTRTDSTPAVTRGPQVKPPLGKLSLLFNRTASLVVVTDTQAATNLRVVHATLQEAITGAQLPATSLALCRSGGCGERVSLGRRAANRVELAVDSSFRHKGTFTGNVFLASDENPAGFAPFELTVLSTTHSTRWAGAGLILAGIAVGLLVTVVLRHRALRLQALLPATRLADQARGLRAEVQAAEKLGDTPLPETLARLERVSSELAESNLEALGYVPGRFAPTVPATDASAAYGEFLERIAHEIAVVQLVVVRGFRPVAAMWPQQQLPAINAALCKLDPIAAHTASIDAAAPLVAAVRTELDVAGKTALHAERVEEPAGRPSVQEVRVAFQRTNASLWLVWALVTWVTGIVALIATNYAFGAGLDYYKCFLWGIGVQVAGNQLQQLTPSSVATAFSISMPKVA